MSEVEPQQVRELASAVAELSSNERSLSAWWRLALCATRAGESKLAIDAFDDLGRAASDLGTVALAMGCVMQLRELKDERRANTLLSRVCSTHCLGSKRVGDAKAFVPPVPTALPPADRVEPLKTVPEIKKAALLAIKSASRAARARAPKVLSATPLLQHLSASDMKTLVSMIRLKRYAKGQVILEVGDAADALFWMARGTARVSRDGKLLGELRADAFFGEIALMGTTTRTAQVTSVEESWLLRIPAATVGTMAVNAPNLAKVLATHARDRLLSNVTRTSELFQRLSAAEKKSLMPRFESSLAADGQVLIAAGAKNDSLFVLVSGRCEVRDGTTVLSTLEVGDGFGEMSMLGRKAASCDVVAVGSVVLLRISRAMFDEIAITHPELLAEVYQLLVARERENSDAIIHDADELVI